MLYEKTKIQAYFDVRMDGVLPTILNPFLEIDDGPTYTGTVIDERKIVAVTQKNEVDQICRSYYEHSFPGGGFEGNSLLIIDGFTGSPPPLWDKTKIHYLLKGTRAFEGQTLNVGRTWTPFGGPLGASGFLLVKP
jgi:hypothetical protein